MSTFYAAFPDSISAQEMVRHLINDGIVLDDVSLVSRGTATIGAGGKPSTGDASFFVGRSDDPSHDLVDKRSPDADYEAAEMSRIGGGVATVNIGEDVETIEEMDESQSVAEDLGWPREDTSSSAHELDDLNRAVRTGFPTPPTPIDNDVSDLTEVDRSLEGIVVPGVGIVMGGGDMATAAFDWAGKNGDPNPTSFLTYLQDEGVPPGAANELLDQFGNGGAILAVALLPEVDEGALEQVAEGYGAVSTGWYGAPRF